MKFLLSFSLFSLCLGCIPEDSNKTKPTNSIEIISVSPKSAEAGVYTTFTISINYKLVDLEQGEVNIGFNVNQQDSYIIFSDDIINKGSGSLIATISAIPADYAPNGSFGVYAHISEYPHPDTFTALTSEVKDITVTQSMSETRLQAMHKDFNHNELICFIDYEGQCINY